MSGGDGLAEPWRGLGNGVGGGEADGVEAVLARSRDDRRAQRLRVAQKSRSA
jgi:hypothetical protein